MQRIRGVDRSSSVSLRSLYGDATAISPVQLPNNVKRPLDEGSSIHIALKNGDDKAAQMVLRLLRELRLHIHPRYIVIRPALQKAQHLQRVQRKRPGAGQPGHARTADGAAGLWHEGAALTLDEAIALSEGSTLG